MAGSRIGFADHGWLIPDRRIGPDTFDSAASSFTEASPQPTGLGTPSNTSSKLRTYTSGAQDLNYIAPVLQAGNPGSALRLGYRYDTDGSTDTRGWEAHNRAVDWTAAEYGSVTAYTAPDATVIPSNQKIVAVYCTGTTTIYTRTWDPVTFTWGSQITAYTGTDGDYIAGIACIPGTERLFIVAAGANTSADSYGILLYSDDDGATWTLGSRGVLGSRNMATSDDMVRAQLLYSRGDLLFVIARETKVTPELTTTQFASNSLGASFTRMAEYDNFMGGAPDTEPPSVAITDSGFVLTAFVAVATDRPSVYRTGSLWEPLANTTAQEVATTSVDQVAIWKDDDGRVYIAGRGATTGVDKVYLWVSEDQGISWEAYDQGILDTGDTDAKIEAMLGVASVGGSHLLHQWTATVGNEDDSIGCLHLGMWSSIQAGQDFSGSSGITTDAMRYSFGPTATSGRDRLLWLPWELPADMAGAWTRDAGSGGTVTLAGGFAVFATVAQTESYSVSTSTDLSAEGLSVFQVNTGGALATNLCGIRIHLADTTDDYLIQIKATTTGFRVTDENATADLDATVDMTTPTHIRWAIDPRTPKRLYVAYRKPAETLWTEVWDTTLTSNVATPAATGTIHWGHYTSGSANSSWRLEGASWGLGFDPLRTELHGKASATQIIGKGISAREYPLSDLTTAGLATSLAARGGPGLEGESSAHDAESDYAARLIQYQVAPSPDREARATVDSADWRYAWNPSSYDTRLGTTSPALYVDGCNVRYVNLQGWDGAIWVDVVTADLATGFTSLNYSLTGDTLSPRTGTASATRYIYRGELRGGTVKLTGGGATAYVRILDNTEGVWRDSDARQVSIYLDIANASGVFPSSSYDCEIWAPRGFAVAHNVVAHRDKYAVEIPLQDTADDDLRIGVALIGAYVPMGQEWSRGFQREFAPNVDVASDRYGTESVTQTGPVLPSWSIQWNEGAYTDGSSGASPDPSWYSAGAGQPGLVNLRDAPFLMSGLLTSLNSGAVPVVCVAGCPSGAGGTVTDPSLIFYGWLASPVTLEHIEGDEGTDEWLRVMGIRITGIV